MFASLTPPLTRAISLRAYARLHMGFFDMDGTLGRRFGSIGVGLNELYTRLDLSLANDWEAEGAASEKGLMLAQQLAARLQSPVRARIRLHETIPEHAGLGSGTQLALAVGVALTRLAGLNLTVREIAGLMNRGARSGIGIGTFEHGGLVVDGGRKPGTLVPPLLSRLALPDGWRFILVLDEADQGLSGSSEISAFQTLPPFPEARAALAYGSVSWPAAEAERTKLRSEGHEPRWDVVPDEANDPAVAEQDLPAFGAAISEIQQVIGEYFAPAQGGRCHTSSRVADWLHYLHRQGAVGIGQSSWGPTGFCMVDTPTRAAALVRAAREHLGETHTLRVLVASARNRGADLQFNDEDE